MGQHKKLKNKSRRVFFRAITAALGINAFKEKNPFINEAEGHGGGRWSHEHCRQVDGNQAWNAPRCGSGHVSISVYYPRDWGSSWRNKTTHYCSHWVHWQNSRGQLMCNRDGGGRTLGLAGADTGSADCFWQTAEDPKGIERRKRRCERGNSSVNIDNNRHYVCEDQSRTRYMTCHDWF